MKELLKYRNQIYGFSALWILFFHINNHVPISLPILSLFLKVGNCGVDIFMFLSGYCLTLSYNKNPNLTHFYKKRVTRLLIPYLLISIPYYWYKNIVRTPTLDGHFNLLGFINDITGYSFWFEGLRTTWFVFAIFLMYLLFPAFYRIIKRNIIQAFSLVFLLYLLIVFLYLFNSGYSLYSIAVCRFPTFVMGMIFSLYKLGPKHNKYILLLSICYLVVFIFVFPIRIYLPTTLMWLFYMSFVVPIIYLIGFVSERVKIKGICNYVGLISLEIYLIHVMILNIMNWHGFIQEYNYYLFIIVPVLALALSWIFSILSKNIINKIIQI